MPATVATRRSRLLSRATMIPLAAATDMVRAVKPVLEAPSLAQRALEGAFFDAVRDLHYRSDRPAAGSLMAQRVVITRIVPSRHRLEVRLSSDTVLTNWLPTAVPSLDEDGVLCGVPGLRLRVPGPDRVSLTRVGERAEIVLVGAATAELDAYLVAHHDARRRLHAMTTLHPAEVEVEQLLQRPLRDRSVQHDSMSTAIRRLGLLTPFRPRSVDCWAWLGGGTVVEIFAARLGADAVEAFIRDMTSDWLEPRLHLRVRDGDERIAVRLVFASDDARSFLQVRLRGD